MKMNKRNAPAKMDIHLAQISDPCKGDVLTMADLEIFMKDKKHMGGPPSFKEINTSNRKGLHIKMALRIITWPTPTPTSKTQVFNQEDRQEILSNFSRLDISTSGLDSLQ